MKKIIILPKNTIQPNNAIQQKNAGLHAEKLLSDAQPADIYIKQAMLPFAKKELFKDLNMYEDKELAECSKNNGNGIFTDRAAVQIIHSRIERLDCHVGIGSERTALWLADTVKLGLPLTIYNYGDGASVLRFGRVQKLVELGKEELRLQFIYGDNANSPLSRTNGKGLRIREPGVDVPALEKEINEWHQKGGLTILMGREGEEKLVFCGNLRGKRKE